VTGQLVFHDYICPFPRAYSTPETEEVSLQCLAAIPCFI
jgi:hypothetical protein